MAPDSRFFPSIVYAVSFSAECVECHAGSGSLGSPVVAVVDYLGLGLCKRSRAKVFLRENELLAGHFMACGDYLVSFLSAGVYVQSVIGSFVYLGKGQSYCFR